MGIGLSVDCVGQLMLHCMLKVVLMLFDVPACVCMCAYERVAQISQANTLSFFFVLHLLPASTSP